VPLKQSAMATQICLKHIAFAAWMARWNLTVHRGRNTYGAAHVAHGVLRACLQEEDTRRLLAYAKELEDRAIAAKKPYSFYETEARTASSPKK
jgi:hypothetical protein